MQTFIPYMLYEESARCLDRQRLGKQRVEAWQILRNLTGYPDRWRNHPAVKMWKGYESSLAWYGMKICREWINRGYKDSLFLKFLNEFHRLPFSGDPPWLTREFCLSHRSNLLRKFPDYYSKFEWNIPDNIPYIWPTKTIGEINERG